MKSCLLFLIALLGISSVSAQQTSPYITSFKKDGPVIAAGIGLSYLGLHLIKNKKGLTAAQVNVLKPSDVIFFDRFAAGNYSESANKNSYYPFYGSFALPFVLLLNDNVNNNTGQVLALYVETMSVTGSLYSITAGSINRSRPYVYGTDAPIELRTDKGARRSFFAGHTAATATATFFAAKVFADFNPDSRAKPYAWTAAALIPASVAYYRLKAGRHFLSDNLIGYAIGAGAGILIPQLHKKDKENKLSITPVAIPGYQSAALSYTF